MTGSGSMFGGGMTGGGMPGGGGPGMRRGGNMGRMEQLRQSDPEMAKLEEADLDLERQTHEMAEQFRRAQGTDDRDLLKQELTAIVDKHFQVRQERRELEIKRLETQLERLRTSLKKRMVERQAIVRQRISNLLGDDELGF